MRCAQQIIGLAMAKCGYHGPTPGLVWAKLNPRISYAWPLSTDSISNIYMALSSSGIFDKLANEILDQILQEVIAHNIQEYCVPPTECHPTQNWSSLTVLPRVCRRFRDISFHLFSLAFKMDFEGVNPGYATGIPLYSLAL